MGSTTLMLILIFVPTLIHMQWHGHVGTAVDEQRLSKWASVQHSRDTMFLLPLMSKLKKLDCVSKPQNYLSCGHCKPCVWHLVRQGHVLLSACLGSVVPASVCGVGGALISFPMVAVILVTSMFHPGCQWNELLRKYHLAILAWFRTPVQH